MKTPTARPSASRDGGSSRRSTAPSWAGDAHVTDVEERHSEDQRRREECDDRVPLGPFSHYRQTGEGEADERGAAVPEKDLGAARPEVVRHEAEARAHQRGRQVHEVAL